MKNASSLFLFDSAKFGVDMALAESLMNTGDLKHDYEKAAECLELELDFSKVTYSTDSLETANVMINLASALFYSDHFDEAEIHYTNALAIYNAHSGSGKEIPSPKPFALIYTGLGDINYLRGKELAAMYVQRAAPVTSCKHLRGSGTFTDISVLGFV